MKQKSNLRLTVLIILALAIIMSLTSCSASTDIGMVDDLTEDFLDMLLADDYDSAYALVSENVSANDFKPYWDSLKKTSEGASAYEIEQIGWKININNGTKFYVAAFNVELNNGRALFIRTTLVDGANGISGLYFNDTTDFNASFGLFARIANIVLIAFSLLTTAFIVWMLIDCIRRKIAKKPLWLLLIIIGAGVSLVVGQKMGINFHLGLFFMGSSAVADPSILSVTTKVIVPVGAIVYFFMRKRLTLKSDPAEQTAENSENTDV